jgi:hypothetical protein
MLTNQRATSFWSRLFPICFCSPGQHLGNVSQILLPGHAWNHSVYLWYENSIPSSFSQTMWVTLSVHSSSRLAPMILVICYIKQKRCFIIQTLTEWNNRSMLRMYLNFFIFLLGISLWYNLEGATSRYTINLLAWPVDNLTNNNSSWANFAEITSFSYIN